MRGWAARLAALGPVAAFDYPYMKVGRKLPDRLPALLDAHREALREARRLHPARPAVLCGKSLGSRVGCHLSLEEPVAALICLGYPLRSPAGALRDAVLRDLRTPVLFVQGTRDPLCPLDELERARGAMKSPSRLHLVEGGDHSLRVPKRGRLSQEQADAAALAAVADFLKGTT